MVAQSPVFFGSFNNFNFPCTAVDPNAGLLAKAAAAVAGFEGVSMLKEHMGQSSPQDTDDAAAGDPDDSNAQA
jgi:hypothetical protein